MAAAITTRQTAATGATAKGSPLTNAEMDANLIALNAAIRLVEQRLKFFKGRV